MNHPLEVAEDAVDGSPVLRLRANLPELRGIEVSLGDCLWLPEVEQFGAGGLRVCRVLISKATLGDKTEIKLWPAFIGAGHYRNVERLPRTRDQVWIAGEYSTARLCGMPEQEIAILREVACRIVAENR